VLKSHNSAPKAIAQLTDTDRRLVQLREWLRTVLDGTAFSLSSASADASFRRYFRISDGARSWIAMDAPPDREDQAPFIRIAGLMRAAGLHVPQVIAHDLEQGFLLLSDLGDTTYLQALDDKNADSLFGAALDALLAWQLASRPGVLPPYDDALLRRETGLFKEWYVGRHLGITLGATQHERLAQVENLLVQAALAQPMVYVHRDFMPRNLMLGTPEPGVLDFQDAVYGPITYDVVSLFRDAYISWDEERVAGWTRAYWEKAQHAGLPVSGFQAFSRDLDWVGVQRHLKILGIFARIHYRDGKPGYLSDTPRFLNYVRTVAARYEPLYPLIRLLDELDTGMAPGGGS